MLTAAPWRNDVFLGLGNMLAFFEHLASYADGPLTHSLTLLYFDLVNLTHINAVWGEEAGNQVLRWLALALQDEIAPQSCYRLRGDEFTAILQDSTPEEALEIVSFVQSRLLRLTGMQPGVQLEAQPLHIGILQVEAGTEIQVVDMVISMETVIQQMRRQGSRLMVTHYPLRAEVDLGTTVQTLIDRLLELGSLLDRAIGQAESDPLTGLPNSRAMSRYLHEAITRAAEQQRRFAVLMVDGDNLRAFNKISYAVGDAMIQQLSQILANGLRSEDKLARWRLGDEFLILLPDAGAWAATHVANRLVRTVREATWELPVTISIGIALFPEHGQDAESLAANVELALTRAKAEGKDQAVLFGG